MFEIKRKILGELINHLEKQEVSMIVGPRQAGKTTVMMMLQKYLENKGEKTLFLDLDIENDRKFFVSQETFFAKLDLEFGDKKGFVFIDEIQRKGDAGLFLKGIYDSRTPHKFIVSGSGSIELKEKLHESMAGRKLLFCLDTVNFREFLNFKTGYRYESKLADFCRSEEKGTLPNLLNEYINFGGYPRVVLDKTLEDKTRTIDEIYSSYLIKDISFLLKVDKIDAIGNLFRVLASQIGQLVNYSEMSSTIDISQATLKNYIYYGEKTFVISRIPPFYRNPRKEIVKSPSIYFTDLGLRNYCSGWFGRLSGPQDMGFVFQNFIYGILKDRLANRNGKISFWRTKDRAEVDFVVDLQSSVVPVEVKYKEIADPEIGRSLRNFIAKYEPKQAIVVNLLGDHTVKLGSTDVIFMPYWKLLNFDF